MIEKKQNPCLIIEITMFIVQRCVIMFLSSFLKVHRREFTSSFHGWFQLSSIGCNPDFQG